MTQRKAADSPTKNCTAPDCDRPLRARGLCHMHWKREYGKPKLCEVECPTCGIFTTKRDDGASTRRFCSLLCRDIWRIDQPDDPMYRHRPRGPRGPRLCRLPSSHPVMWVGRSSPVQFGPCGWCGQPTCRGENNDRAYCSAQCKQKAKTCRRRGREAQDFGYWTWFDFMHIARRFDYRCAYCHVKPDGVPLQPDHVIPVSKGGPNTVSNLLPSCAQCNADKRDLLLHEWAVDRAVRGKPALATSWAPEDKRYYHLTSLNSPAA